MTAECRNQFFVLIHRPSHAQTGIQCSFESRRCLQSVNLERVERREFQRRPLLPGHLGTLAITQLDMSLRHAVGDVTGDFGSEVRPAGIQQTVSQTNQMVANVNRCTEIILPMQRFPTVPVHVVIFDVVMNKRRFVKRFDRHGNSGDAIRHRQPIDFFEVRFLKFSTGHRVVSRQRDERSKSFAAVLQPVVSQLFGKGDR